MIRSVASVAAAILVVFPVIGLAQQELSDTSESARPEPRSSPEALAVREGVADALQGVVAPRKTAYDLPSGTWGIISEGSNGGGIFSDSDGTGYAWLGYDRPSGTDLGGTANAGEYGVYAGGNKAGGYFEAEDSTGYAYIGDLNRGIRALGSFAGGQFADSDGTGYAWLAYDRPSGTDPGGSANSGEYGVYAGGSKAGGYFEAGNGTGYAYLGDFNRGLRALGSYAGGQFADSDGSGRAWLAYDRPSGTDAGGESNDGEYGAYAAGDYAGGYFEDSNGSGYAYVGRMSWGIDAYGGGMGGRFSDIDDSGVALLAAGDHGIDARGNEWAGKFSQPEGRAFAYLAYDRDSGTDSGGTSNAGDYGVYAAGDDFGGYFESVFDSGYAYVGTPSYGIKAYGAATGGRFHDTDSSAQAYIAYDTYKLYSTGDVAFVQNHPYDQTAIIVYAAPEGDEVATYTRGSSRLIHGAAKVTLGETFKWVTNPDIGLTVHLTPVGGACTLYVADKGTDEITVRSNDGADCAFDFLVYGLRIGFEEQSVVQEKDWEAYIPSMASHRKLYQLRPDLRRYNSLERFKEMRRAAGEKQALDLSRSRALRDAIIEFDPAVHELPWSPRGQGTVRRMDGGDGHLQRAEDIGQARAFRAERGSRRAADRSDLRATVPADDEENVYAASFRSSARGVASLVSVSEAVEPGDVLVIDRVSAGMMRQASEGHDSGVVGVVAAQAGVVLGSPRPSSDDESMAAETSFHAGVSTAGFVDCKVDADYGAIWPGDLLVTSPTPGHAMRADSPLPGTIIGKALEPLEEGTGLITVLVMLR